MLEKCRGIFSRAAVSKIARVKGVKMNVKKISKSILPLIVLVLISVAVFCGCNAVDCEDVSIITITGKPAGGLFEYGSSGNRIELDISAKGSEPNFGKKIKSFSVAWKSSNRDVAEIDKNGCVTVHSRGEASISAAVIGNADVKDAFVLTVYDIEQLIPNPDKAVTILGRPTNDEVYADAEPFSLYYQAGDYGEHDLTWASSDGKVAIIDSDGKVTVKKAGQTEITLTDKKGICRARFTLFVKGEAATRIEIVDKPLYSRLAAGQTAELSTAVLPLLAEPYSVVWSSSAPSVASVTDGTVTAKSVGRTVIGVTANGTLTDSFELIVYDGTQNCEDFENVRLFGDSVGQGNVTIGSHNGETRLSVTAAQDMRPKNSTGKYLTVTNTDTNWAGPTFRISNIKKGVAYRAFFDIKLISGYPILNFQLICRNSAGADVTGATVYKSLHMIHGESFRFFYDYTPIVDAAYAELAIYTASNAENKPKVDAVFSIDNITIAPVSEFLRNGFEDFEAPLNSGYLQFAAYSDSGYAECFITEYAQDIPYCGISSALKFIAAKTSDARLSITGRSPLSQGNYTLTAKLKTHGKLPALKVAGSAVQPVLLKDTDTYLFSVNVAVTRAGSVTISFSAPYGAAIIFDDISLVRTGG